MVEIRRPRLSEQATVNELVRAVVLELYSDLFAPPGPPIIFEDWTLGWAALLDGEVVGIAHTQDDRLGDLWLAPRARSQGIGAQLLDHAEREIAERGHAVAKLRVVARNTRAQAFYARHGWTESRRYPHETAPTEMVEMTKPLT